MTKILLAILGVTLLSFSAHAEKVKDWKDLDAVHNKVKQAINDMAKARAANHYDMAGHGEKAEQDLKDAEKELAAAVQSAKSAR